MVKHENKSTNNCIRRIAFTYKLCESEMYIRREPRTYIYADYKTDSGEDRKRGVVA